LVSHCRELIIVQIVRLVGETKHLDPVLGNWRQILLLEPTRLRYTSSLRAILPSTSTLSVNVHFIYPPGGLATKMIGSCDRRVLITELPLTLLGRVRYDQVDMSVLLEASTESGREIVPCHLRKSGGQYSSSSVDTSYVTTSLCPTGL
jgi:hypothetical protein